MWESLLPFIEQERNDYDASLQETVPQHGTAVTEHGMHPGSASSGSNIPNYLIDSTFLDTNTSTAKRAKITVQSGTKRKHCLDDPDDLWDQQDISDDDYHYLDPSPAAVAASHDEAIVQSVQSQIDSIENVLTNTPSSAVNRIESDPTEAQMNILDTDYAWMLDSESGSESD